MVRLPFSNTDRRLGASRGLALRRLTALERRFQSNATLKAEYNKVIEEYLELNYLSVVKESNEDGYYMPHHAVFKDSSDTTKLRVVFDASAKADNGVSLNDLLLIGPTIQDKLFAQLIRFRTYKYVITADIKKMYLQILVHADDRCYQRILWRRNKEIETFQFNTLTFGVASSPFLATRVLKKLADDEHRAFPRAAEVLKSHMYMDDLLSGAESIDEARAIRDELIALLARGGFAIRQWAANDENIINDLPTSMLRVNFAFDKDISVKTLGLIWYARGDEIHYEAHLVEVTQRLTKRNILSEIAKIFDPLGLLGPIVLYAKKLMQDVWRAQLDWDESIPQGIYTAWLQFVQQFESINRISFDRRVLTNDYRDVQIHGFCDASKTGYGACLYIRSTGENNEITIVRLLCAKSRVAPLKPITIPRLELSGALLLARLYNEVESILNVVPSRIIFWCDSSIVLHWLRTPPHQLNAFVANRVEETQRLTETVEWRHIRSEDNSADAISRGQLPREFMQNRTWYTGPTWLVRDEEGWPKELIQLKEIPELRKNVCLVAMHNDVDIFEKFSSHTKLLRIVAYCRRFRPANIYSGSLGVKEIDETEIHVLKMVQASQFGNEIKVLQNKGSITKGRLSNLSPYLDDKGLIRVGGRLQKSNLAFASKHPMLLPSRHRLSDNIIRETHERYHHAGIQTTLSILRQRFWLLDGKNQVRKVVRTCIRCFRFDPNTVEYKMGNLPSARVCEAIPFVNTGVDFCGPFHIKEKKYRNRNRIKVYVCVFVCMAVKAVHLEVVSDLTSEGFLAALRRFVARRGVPGHIFSDNGTNFVGANNSLKEVYALFNSEEHKDLVKKFANNHRITWHFIPPVAPHFGGLWESTVKIFKHHFKRVIGDSLLTFEELNTFTVEVEGILNSRPITSLSSDPNDLLVLTPAHYLIGKPLTALPERDVSSVPANRLSVWQHLTKMRQDFWARWRLEYLNELQTRNKWLKDGPRIDIGTVVLIKDKNLPCTQWPIGRITEIHPGEDGIVRAATIKTGAGEMKRAATQLCPLPLGQ